VIEPQNYMQTGVDFPPAATVTNSAIRRALVIIQRRRKVDITQQLQYTTG